MTNEQFNNAFTAAGGWFIAEHLELFEKNLAHIESCSDSKTALISQIFNYGNGPDKNIGGTKTRVNATLNIIRNHRADEALVKISESTRIAPAAVAKAGMLLNKRGH